MKISQYFVAFSEYMSFTFVSHKKYYNKEIGIIYKIRLNSAKAQKWATSLTKKNNEKAAAIDSTFCESDSS